jgi:hypothetical protein
MLHRYRCKLATLSTSGVRLFNDCLDLELAHWHVAYCTPVGDGGTIWQETNATALAIILQMHHGDKTARTVSGALGESVVLVDPDQDEALAHAEKLLARVESGEHLDTGGLAERLDEAIADYWEGQSWSGRIKLLKMSDRPVHHYSDDVPPECLRPMLVQLIET